MNLYIYGIIGEDIFLKDIAQKINSSEEENIDIRINSPGGSVREGFAIYDYLKNSGKKIDTYADGMCGSMATVIFLVGENRYIAKNAEFFIHMPLAGMQGYYNAQELDRHKEDIKKEEKKILDIYKEKTSLKEEELINMMDKETGLDSANAIRLGFATQLSEPMKAVAFLDYYDNNKNKKKMEKETNNLNKMLDKIWNFLTGSEKVNLKITDAEGKELDVNTDSNEYAVGDEVTIEGNPAPDGQYIIPSAKDIIVVSSGKISEIKKNEVETEKKEKVIEEKAIDLDEKDIKINQLEEENNHLKTRVDELEVKMIEYKNTINEMTEKVEKTFSKITSTYKPPTRMQDFRDKKGSVEESEELKMIKRKISNSQNIKF